MDFIYLAAAAALWLATAALALGCGRLHDHKVTA